MLLWIKNNYRTFLWALALGIAVWVAAVTSADPNETRALPGSIPIEIIGQDPNLVINNQIPANVTVTLRAPQSIWNTLLTEKESVRALLDVSGLSAGEHVVEIQIQVDARPVQVLSISPHSVALNLEPLESITLPVNLVMIGEAAIGYQVGEVKIEPATVFVAGPQTLVRKVQSVRAVVPLDNTRADIVQNVPIEAFDENDVRVDGVKLSPNLAQVTIPIILQGGYRDLAVKVLVTGRVASGYRLTDISVFPPVVTVFAADPDIVKNLPGILETQPLDLNNAQEDINTRLSLNLPPGVTIVGEQTVRIEAGISAIESSITLANESVEVIGLGSGLSASISPLFVDVILSGPLPLLDTLTRQDIRVTVDLTGLTTGTHQVKPKVEILVSNLEVESVLPNTVEVIITSNSVTPSPTPKP